MSKRQRCKYLRDIGLKKKQYGTNFTRKGDPREKRWAKERKEYGFDSRETWNLDTMFVEWIYTRVLMYKERTPADMSLHKISHNGRELTQGEAMDRILSLAKEVLLDRYHDDDLRARNCREICDIWKEILPMMWI